MTPEMADKVYSVLVMLGGAPEGQRDSFVYHHCSDPFTCTEWRFQGRLGFGGKYRSQTNSVDCYREDETETRRNLIRAINDKLAKL
jgi:hypothetical protein